MIDSWFFDKEANRFQNVRRNRPSHTWTHMLGVACMISFKKMLLSLWIPTKVPNACLFFLYLTQMASWFAENVRFSTLFQYTSNVINEKNCGNVRWRFVLQLVLDYLYSLSSTLELSSSLDDFVVADPSNTHSIHVYMVYLPTFTIKINHPCR